MKGTHMLSPSTFTPAGFTVVSGHHCVACGRVIETLSAESLAEAVGVHMLEAHSGANGPAVFVTEPGLPGETQVLVQLFRGGIAGVSTRESSSELWSSPVFCYSVSG